MTQFKSIIKTISIIFILLGINTTWIISCSEPEPKEKDPVITSGMPTDQMIKEMNNNLVELNTKIDQLKIKVEQSSGPDGFLTILLLINIILTIIVGFLVWKMRSGNGKEEQFNNPSSNKPKSKSDEKDSSEYEDEVGSDYFRGE